MNAPQVVRPPALHWRGLALLLLAGCRVTFPDDALYQCDVDADCAGAAYKCIGTSQRYCCAATGNEVCGDGVDNDCDGNVDGNGRVEVCNGIDDNCAQGVDEGFNLASDRANCGRCGNACKSNEVCTAGVCAAVVELFCSDGVDNDRNGALDCADTTCEGRDCGEGCLCRSGSRAEADCNDAKDNDQDSTQDCFDSDCVGRSCGMGCACQMGGQKAESSCFDALDNDGDGQVDCNDSDCVSKFCSVPPLFFTCNAAAQCKCNNGAQVAEVGTTFCGDGLDNDCNGKTDCQETQCDGLSCTKDGGTGTCQQQACR